MVGCAGQVTSIPLLTRFYLKQPDRRKLKLEDGNRIANFHAAFCCCKFAMVGRGTGSGGGWSAMMFILTSRHHDAFEKRPGPSVSGEE